MNALENLTEPAPGGVCRVCEQRLPDGSLACAVCGAVYGEANRCPHCRAVAGIEPGQPAGRCRVCGGPRIVANDARTVRSGREVHLLRQAEQLRRKRRLNMLFGSALVLSAAFAVTLTLLMILVTDPGALVAAVALAFAGGLAAFGAPLLRDAARVRTQRKRLLDQARLIVASDVVASHGRTLPAADLARILQTSQEDAELLLAEIDLSQLIRARVSLEGELSYPAVPSRADATWAAEELLPGSPELHGDVIGPATQTAEAMALVPPPAPPAKRSSS